MKPPRRVLAFAVLCAGWLSVPARAQNMPIGAMPMAAQCHDAARAAEQNYALPPGLLDAIGRVESGQYDPLSGKVSAWPWTVNAAGEGQHFATRDDAAAFVRERQAAGTTSIDVGCFQISLLYHPDAFATLEQGFDPVANADYAAQFLVRLHERAGGWETAVALYHSATPMLGDAYRDQVLAWWQTGNGLQLGTGLAVGPAPIPAAGPDPFVILVARLNVALPHVIEPHAAPAAAPIRGRLAASWPRIISPAR